MLFRDVIGQTRLKHELINSVKSNKISHAQLFLGPLGHGGLPLALAYSQYLNCENPGEQDTCGTCPSCIKARKLVHPDIHFSYPFPRIDKKEKATEFIKDWREAILENPYLNLTSWLLRFNAENKQANIPIKECHDIIRKLSLKAFESSHKVLILWLPEYLGKEGNSLLKMLEEPPEKTVFILIAENQDAILNTIISRTQIVKIPNLEIDEVQSALQEKFQVSEEEAFKLASISNGNYAEALNLLNNALGDIADLFLGWFETCMPDYKGNKVLEIHQWVEKFALIGRENQKSFFRYGLHFLREAMNMYLTNKDSDLLTEEELSFAYRVKQFIDLQKSQELYEWLNSAHYYMERNANPRIVLMNVSIKISRALKQNKVFLV